MSSLVTRFHLLLLTVTLAITGVALFRVPVGYQFAAHWQGGAADWQWPRDLALAVAPVAQVTLMLVFFGLGRSFTRNQFVKSQHILDPALSLLMAVVAASQLGLLLTGVGSDLDFIRFTGLALGAALLVLGVVLFEAQRHTYAGLRMPWPIASDRGWRLVHRTAGIAFGVAGLALGALAWTDPGIGVLVAAFVPALIVPPLLAGLMTLLSSRA